MEELEHDDGPASSRDRSCHQCHVEEQNQDSSERRKKTGSGRDVETSNVEMDIC